MAWSAPMTAVANSTFTAAQFNQHVRDNLNETAPAKATSAGNYFVADGVNSIAERTPNLEGILTSETTISTSFTDLATIGPTVTVTTGPYALVLTHCQMDNVTTGSAYAGVEVTGASSIAPALNRSINIFNASAVRIGAGTAVLYAGSLALTPGVNTFTMKYRVSSGLGTFGDRRIIVMPL
ncbi:hypothetical protein PV733_37055 [Streptomyces europaeiscabiei]|uniref:Uncharacterized protein n=1 Tax=Streptomyces europaeiscabiei TaxID=146819 RepID=A0ABU4NWQ5_9ACTN|nr:hypothetical protein [Streptomyces europaeiscabiei]MDX2759142.1 hypothetical protein [Streptomyces europaeiscabiei]MDX2767040.1 hypothetical protein [Streptomyces europaeiscabiei]MDX3549768.1 hypothetical protein [Streptomyces europaeiscabiei]MDX3558758.1 hypothetical protein [Streptomyces europaeiscabiei]MDX3707109.1 hypothetical protein [Streptomyces europaeiscabiei]